MSSEEAFLRAIQEDPDDDLPRQVLADWLDDTGRPERAEFIRVQLELARGVADPVQRNRLLYREEELLKKHVRDWLGPFADLDPANRRYRRGTAHLRFATDRLLDSYPGPLVSEWLRRGWVLDLCPQGDARLRSHLFEQSWLGQLCSLTLDGRVPWDVERLASCPGLQRLTRLGLCGGFVTADDLAALETGLPRLHRLNLSHNPMRREHIEALWCILEVMGIGSLQLADCGLTGELVEQFVSSMRVSNLEELNLNRDLLRGRGGEAVAGSPHLANLRRLGLRDTYLHGEGATALIRSPYLQRIEMLDVWDCHFGRSSLERLHARFGAALWLKVAEPPCWDRP
jgi:uncharacterized protein (TIGR02996 family)